jgi:hypothetical protein
LEDVRRDHDEYNDQELYVVHVHIHFNVFYLFLLQSDVDLQIWLGFPDISSKSNSPETQVLDPSFFQHIFDILQGLSRKLSLDHLSGEFSISTNLRNGKIGNDMKLL